MVRTLPGSGLGKVKADPGHLEQVLYTSGYTEDAILHHRVLSPGIALMQKPITPDSLLGKVREVLEARR